MDVITRTHPRFPPPLLQVRECPQQLFVRGQLAALDSPLVSVVGSRRPTAYARQVTELLIPDLVRAGLGIVSGLAYGIDALAHQVALRVHGTCVAVLGSGFDRIYPAVHAGLAQDIQHNGCLVSAYPPDTPPRPYFFLERNRIIAALSPVAVVIEAGERSGTLSTAKAALECGQTVAVVLGDITRSENAGCYLLAHQGAHIVRTAADIISLYRLETAIPAAEILKPALTGSAAAVYDCILRGCRTVAGMASATGYAPGHLQSILSVLELDGYIINAGPEWLIISSS